MTRKTCFVVMGFGEKTDYHSNPQRVLNLNSTFDHIIEPAVLEAGLTCIRADKIIHSTVIDKPMYEQLLKADVVVADLSTANPNAIYELGVRHALRPRRTIVMAENNFSFPFDLNHVSILKYEHLGKEVGAGEAQRAKERLKEKLVELVDQKEIDSPVFLFLPELTGAAAAPAPTAAPQSDKSFADLLESYRQAKKAVDKPADWVGPIAILNVLRRMQPDDPYLVQQLALATYKSEQPDKIRALVEAKEILRKLEPTKSSDAETVGLWGAIHKRLWSVGGNPEDLNAAIHAYRRGFYIKADYYNGINYAFLLDIRATRSFGEDAIADRVLARRIRQEVLTICAELGDAGTPADFWAEATRVEALLGLGRGEEAEELRRGLIAANPEPWMIRTLEEQLAELRKVLAATG